MNVPIKQPSDIYNLLRKYGNKRQEHFIVLTLDGAHKVIKTHTVTIGLVNKTIVHPREVFWKAIKDNAAAVVLAHNHPSGELKPSAEDDEITERLHKAAVILGFHLLDHIIFTKNSWYSFKVENRLNNEYDNQSLKQFVYDIGGENERKLEKSL